MKNCYLLVSGYVIYAIGLLVVGLTPLPASAWAEETRYEFFAQNTSEHLVTLGLHGQQPYEPTDVAYLEFTDAGNARFGFGTGRIQPTLTLHRGDLRIVEEGSQGLMAETDFDTIWRDSTFPIQVGFGIRDALDRFDKPGFFRTDGNWVRSLATGDLNGDGQIDVVDIDLLRQALIDGSIDPIFDLDMSGQLDRNDLHSLVADHLGTWIGDANLDQVFNNDDIVLAFVAGEYRDTVANNSTWATGDWDADGEFTEADLVAAFIDGGYNQGPRPAAMPVPEPHQLIVAVGALAWIASRSGRQQM